MEAQVQGEAPMDSLIRLITFLQDNPTTCIVVVLILLNLISAFKRNIYIVRGDSED